MTTAPARLDGLRAEAVLADKAYDTNALRAIMGAIAVIYLNRTRKSRSLMTLQRTDTASHERCFTQTLQTLRNALQRAIHFLAFVQIAAAMIWLS